MNGQKIKKYALLHTGLNEIPESYLILYINKAMDELANMYDTACKKNFTIIESEGEEWEELSNDVIAIKKVYKLENGTKAVYNNYIYENEMIKFGDKGEYEVEFICPHDELKYIANTPEINSRYHIAITYYVAYEELCRVFMHEDTNKDYLLLRFKEKAKEANNKLSFAKRTGKVMACRSFE